jgi:hypothetical protein
MAISKQRLQELIEKGATISTDGYRGSHFKIKLAKHFVAKLGNSIDLYGYGCDYFGVPLNHLFEPEEEAKFVVKNHTSRMEEFKPPFKLERGESYKFVSKKYGNAEIWHSWENGREYIVTDERYEGGDSFSFCTYDEAVEFARELFLGKDS